jgi:uncharacterized repeat protein (TIGR01451 family)
MNGTRFVAVIGVTLMSVFGGAALAQKPVVAAGTHDQKGEPDVAIRKSGGGSVAAGQTAAFTLNTLNSLSSIPIGMSADLNVVDTLPGNFVAPIAASGSGWSCTVAGRVVTCHYVGSTVNPGASFPAISVTARAGEAGRYENCAAVTLGKVKDVKPTDNRSCIRGEVTKEGGDTKYDVGVRKTGPGSLAPGATGTWTLSTINTGPASVNGGSGVVVIDTLPANLTAPISANGSPDWSCTVSGHVVTCNYVGSAIGPNHAMPAITVTAVGGRDPGDGKNCASISVKAGADSKPADNQSCVTVVVTKGSDRKYDVSLRKRGPDSVTTGQVATFTLSPNNNGPSAINNLSGVVVVDTLVAASFTAPVTASGGTNWSCMVAGSVITCTYVGTSLVGPGPMPTITVTAVARRAGDVQNCASIALTRVGPDANPGDNRDCVHVDIKPGTSEKKKYDLSLRKRGPDSVSAGQAAVFVLSPNNNGPTQINNATGITVVDTVPAFFTTPITAVGGLNWNCAVVGHVVTCTYTGTALMGAGPLGSISISAVAGTSGGQNCAVVGLTAATDANTSDNRDCISVVVKKPPTPAPLRITKAILDDCYTNGNGNDTQCTFSFTISNAGSTSWSGPLVMSDVATPMASLALVGGQPAGWTCIGTNPMVCSSNGPVTIPATSSVSFNLTLNVMSAVMVTQNCATLTSSPAPFPSSCVRLGTQTATGSLTIVKNAAPKDSQDFSFHAFGPNSGSIMPFLLDDDAGAAGANAVLSNSKTFPTLATGSYSVSEDLTAGWTVSNVACLPANSATVDLPNRALTVNVTAGANITCTFSNRKNPIIGTGTLTVVKIAQPHDTTGFHFATQGAGLSPFWLDDDGNNSNARSNTKVFTGLAAGLPFTVTEDATPGWTTPSIQCIPSIIGTSTTYTDQLHRTFTVTIAAGVNMTCTVTNLRAGWPNTATVNFYNPMTPFGPQTVDIGVGGTVAFHNVSSGVTLTISYVSGPVAFAPIVVANGSTVTSAAFTTPGTYAYSITGFGINGHIIVH